MNLSAAEQEEIARFIKVRGITRCPPRFVEASEHACAPMPPERRKKPDAKAEEARRAWALFVVEGLPMKQVAVRIGCSECQAYRLTHRHGARSASARLMLDRRMDAVRQDQYASWLAKHRKAVAAPPAEPSEDSRVHAHRLLADGYSARQVSVMTGISRQELAVMHARSGG
jgi:transposase